MKTIDESRSVLSEVMLPSQANPAGTVHGGEIMKLMDACGGVAATRHAKMNVVTVRVDELVFYQPILVGQLVICEAELAFTGKTSMDVKITVKVEDLMSEQPAKVAMNAYFTYVALNKDGKPCEVSGLILKTEAQRKAYELGKERYMSYKKSNNHAAGQQP